MAEDEKKTEHPDKAPEAPAAGIDFSSLPWNLNLPEHHSYVHLTTKKEWTNEHYDAEKDEGLLFSSIHSYAQRELALTPATTSLNYATTVWEGLKCYRLEDGRCIVFRVDDNYERMKHGSAEMCLPMPERRLFLRAIQLAIQKNSHLIPPAGEGMKLYVRPMLAGTGQQLGLYPSPEFSFLVYVSPTGNYFKSATAGLNLHLETKRSRACRGGMGAVKYSGNYGATLKPLMDCKKHGFHDNLFLELDTFNKTGGNLNDAVLQEMSAANVFLVLRTGEIVTPSLDRGTILAGITRDSVLRLIAAYADELKEPMRLSTGKEDVSVTASSRTVTVSELRNATEVFCTGTAAELVPIRRLATAPENGEEAFEVKYETGNTLPGGPVTSALLKLLRESMVGKRQKFQDWLRDPFAPANEFCK